MTPELFISFAGLAIAVIAAVFAERSASASEHSAESATSAAESAASSAHSARHANDIALHNSRLEIYKGLQKFHMTLLQQGYGFPAEALWEFHDHVKLSEFYFPQGVHKEMEVVTDEANELKAKYEYWVHLRDIADPTAPEFRKTLYTFMTQMRERLKTLDDSLRARLRLDRADDAEED